MPAGFDYGQYIDLFSRRYHLSGVIQNLAHGQPLRFLIFIETVIKLFHVSICFLRCQPIDGTDSYYRSQDSTRNLTAYDQATYDLYLNHAVKFLLFPLYYPIKLNIKLFISLWSYIFLPKVDFLCPKIDKQSGQDGAKNTLSAGRKGRFFSNTLKAGLDRD